MHQLFHLATNSLDASGPFVLADVGGPKVTSCHALSCAIAVRTATKTLPGWPALKLRLLSVAEESLPLQLWHKGCVSPTCWDSPPFVMYLSEAAHGFPGQPSVRQGVAAARFELARVPARPHNKRSIQKVVYEHVFATIHHNDLNALFAKRLRDNIPAVTAVLDAVDWADVKCAMRSLGSHCAMCVFKTFVNAWTTSRRFHEAVIASCIFGCTAEDNLAHYLVCNRLWKCVKSAVRMPVGATVQERLGLSQNPKQRMQELAIAFTIFHSIKHGQHELYLDAIRTRNFHYLASAAKSIARTAAASFGRRD